MDITGTLAGTPVYMAPEVFNSKVYDIKADIYSLGIMLWEMWYGQRAYSNIQVATLNALYRMVDDGARPDAVEGLQQPPSRWEQLMIKCWNRNPEERPAAKECFVEVTKLSSEV